MMGKIAFVILMVLLACLVVMLSWLGWANGYAWSRRKEYLRQS